MIGACSVTPHRLELAPQRATSATGCHPVPDNCSPESFLLHWPLIPELVRQSLPVLASRSPELDDHRCAVDPSATSVLHSLGHHEHRHRQGNKKGRNRPDSARIGPTLAPTRPLWTDVGPDSTNFGPTPIRSGLLSAKWGPNLTASAKLGPERAKIEPDLGHLGHQGRLNENDLGALIEQRSGACTCERAERRLQVVSVGGRSRRRLG